MSVLNLDAYQGCGHGTSDLLATFTEIQACFDGMGGNTVTLTYNGVGHFLTFNNGTGATDLQLEMSAIGLIGTNLIHTRPDGTQDILDLCPAVQACETLTVFNYIPATGIITFLDENGDLNQFTLNIPQGFKSVISYDDVLHQLVHQDGDTTTTVMDLNVGILTLTGNQFLNYEDASGTTVSHDLCPVVKNCETETDLDFNPATGVLTFTNETGVPVQFTLPTGGGGGGLSVLTYDPVDHAILHSDGSGNAAQIIPLDNPTISYNDTTGILTHIAPNGDVTNLDIAPSLITRGEDGSIGGVPNLITDPLGFVTEDVPVPSVVANRVQIPEDLVFCFQSRVGENNNNPPDGDIYAQAQIVVANNTTQLVRGVVIFNAERASISVDPSTAARGQQIEYRIDGGAWTRFTTFAIDNQSTGNNSIEVFFGGGSIPICVDLPAGTTGVYEIRAVVLNNLGNVNFVNTRNSVTFYGTNTKT